MFLDAKPGMPAPEIISIPKDVWEVIKSQADSQKNDCLPDRAAKLFRRLFRREYAH
jgi:hypothetical protein